MLAPNQAIRDRGHYAASLPPLTTSNQRPTIGYRNEEKEMEEFEVTSEYDNTTIKVMSYGPQHAIDLAREQGLVGMLHARRSRGTADVLRHKPEK